MNAKEKHQRRLELQERGPWLWVRRKEYEPFHCIACNRPGKEPVIIRDRNGQRELCGICCQRLFVDNIFAEEDAPYGTPMGWSPNEASEMEPSKRLLWKRIRIAGLIVIGLLALYYRFR